MLEKLFDFQIESEQVLRVLYLLTVVYGHQKPMDDRNFDPRSLWCFMFYLALWC